MKEILTRTLTGALFIAAILASLLLHPWAFLALFTLFCIVGWTEYLGLFPTSARRGLLIGGALLNAALFVSAFIYFSGMGGTFIFIIPMFILFVLFFQDQFNRIQARRLRLFILVSGLIYISFTLSTLYIMAYRLDPVGGFSYRWILYSLIFLWTYDTMAYVTGRLLGRHLIWKKVSPGKTWEGAAGGAIFALGVAFLMSRYVDDMGLPEWMVFGLIAIVAGTLGDFLESWMKRGAGKKDSGRILPGHGGVLDRIDSLLFSAPFLTLYLYLIM